MDLNQKNKILLTNQECTLIKMRWKIWDYHKFTTKIQSSSQELPNNCTNHKIDIVNLDKSKKLKKLQIYSPIWLCGK